VQPYRGRRKATLLASVLLDEAGKERERRERREMHERHGHTFTRYADDDSV
jgi:hypothetical protein